jgi:hypothetical protein
MAFLLDSSSTKSKRHFFEQILSTESCNNRKRELGENQLVIPALSNYLSPCSL